MKRRTRRIVAVVVVLLFAGSGFAATVGVIPLSQNTDGVVLNQPGGPSATLVGNTDIKNTSGGVSATSIQWNTTAGSIYFESTAATSATVHKDAIEGTWTNITAVDASGADLTVDPSDKEEATVGGGVSALAWKNASGTAVDDQVVDFVYSAGSSGSVTLHNLPASATFTASTASGDDLGQYTSDSTGSATISVVAGSTEQVYLFTNDAPQFDSASASPQGPLSSEDITLSIDVTDANFPSAQGDSVEVTFYVDGNSAGTDTITSNGTASTNYHVSTGGDHEWYAVASDNYGESSTSSTFSISTPSVLEIRKELQPSEFVNNTTVEITAYYSGSVERRTVTNGTLNLTGFPVDEPIIVRANATGYYTRTAIIETVFVQNTVFLLNSSEQSYLVRFDLQDLTGNYPDSDTVLFVERDLNVNSTTQWQIIAGDNFGVMGVPVNLDRNERYRLRIKNLETGDATVIGAYTAIQDESVTISSGSATINIPKSTRNYTWTATENETAQQISLRYVDDANQTNSIKITIHERFNKSNVLVDNATFSSNDLTYQTSLTADQTNKTWMMELYIDRGDGFMHFRVPLSGGASIAWFPSGLDSVWSQAIAVFVLLISALAFSELNQGVGAVATSLIGGIFWWFGLISGDAVGVGVVLALLVSVIFHYHTRGVGV